MTLTVVIKQDSQLNSHGTNRCWSFHISNQYLSYHTHRYDLMLTCWHYNPMMRPTFLEIVSELSNEAHEKFKEHAYFYERMWVVTTVLLLPLDVSHCFLFTFLPAILSTSLPYELLPYPYSLARDNFLFCWWKFKLKVNNIFVCIWTLSHKLVHHGAVLYVTLRAFHRCRFGGETYVVSGKNLYEIIV